MLLRRSLMYVFSFMALVAPMVYIGTMPPRVNPQAYVPLLHTIAEGESNGNYNAYFGDAANSSIRFTEMSIAEVLQWQADHVKNGSPSSAVGRYQIIRPTLAGLVQELKIDATTPFTPALQDQLAIALLERRGALEYLDNKITREQFAANLAKEWAALPKVIGDNPADSYYAGDSLNQSRVTIHEVYSALHSLQRS